MVKLVLNPIYHIDILRYKLYNKNMSNSRLTFLEPTNFTLPITIFNTLVDDAFYFGYVKNNQANLSGLLNHLIPNLTQHRKELHGSFLNANDGDEILTNKIEENIFKIYFNKYDYCDDGVAVVPFRVNKEHMQDFLDIVDNLLYNLNIDFTGFVRSLLVEYASRRLNQREYFFYYKEISRIKEAILQGIICHFYTKEEKDTFVPISIELSRIDEQNLIIGYNPESEMAYVLPLSNVKRIVLTDVAYDISDDDSDFVYEHYAEYQKTQEEDV